MKVRVLIVDDHKMFREALLLRLSKDPNIEVVGAASDGLDAIAKASELRPDVVCMDVNMPRLNGIDAARRLIAAQPGVKVIALSAHSHKRYIIEMLNAGAVGYVTKDEAGDALLRAIQAVQQEQIYLVPNAAAVLADVLPVDTYGMPPSPTLLDPLERKLLRLLAKNRTAEQMAAELHLLPAVVDGCLHNAMRKLDLHSIAELAEYAIRSGARPA
ncbi:MAG: response regulator transcription factor [Betaproteobacteria bacterium]|nr:response regulator transcription factor [Betaproteobacteria bacterium]